MESTEVLKNITGDLFVGDVKLFFTHPRYTTRMPYRLETFTTPDVKEEDKGILSLEVRSFSSDMVVLCDSRMNAARVMDSLYNSDVASDTMVLAYHPENVGRWTNLRQTSDAKHWSEGELMLKRRTQEQISRDARDQDKPERVVEKENLLLSRLRAQLPQKAVEALRDRRAIIVSRVSNLYDRIYNGLVSNTTSSSGGIVCDNLRVYRLSRSYNNLVFGIYVGDTTDVSALLIVGEVWPKGIITNEQPAQSSSGPTLTVVRSRCTNGSKNVCRIFCICIGNRLEKRLKGMTVEDIAKSKRHYEGYYTYSDCESFYKIR